MSQNDEGIFNAQSGTAWPSQPVGIPRLLANCHIIARAARVRPDDWLEVANS